MEFDATIDLAAHIEGYGPTGSRKAAAEIRDDPVDISFSTCARQISLPICAGDLERI